MAIAGTVYGIGEKLKTRSMPAVTRWNRLEGRPRTHDFGRALKAEVRDALWMLTKQWQLGEFRGDDAGSPVLARICTSAMQFDRFQPGSATVEPFSLAMPLETTVERRPIRWQGTGSKLSFDLRLALGRRWRKMLAKGAAASTPALERLGADYWPAYLQEYIIDAPNPAADADAAICAHADVWQQVGAAAGRAMDGYALLEHIDQGGAAADNIAGAGVDAAKLAALAQRLREWLATLVEQPTDPARDAWQSERFEYRFACAAPDGAAGFHAVADEYYTGHLDWYSLDRDAKKSDNAAPPGPQPALSSSTFIPTSLVFSGMPNTRWWEFEERQTNFGRVTPDTTDIGKLLLLEFGLVYANDWFVFPYTLPLGSIASIKGIALTNVFGERTWIEPVPAKGGAAWDRWSMFQLTGNDTRELVLVPSTPFVLEGAPLEEVAMVRDEMANLVFGIETRVPVADRHSETGRRGWAGVAPRAGAHTRRAAVAAGRRGAGSFPTDEHRGRALDSVSARARAREHARNPAAARSHAAHGGQRSQPTSNPWSRAPLCFGPVSTRRRGRRTSCTKRKCRAPALHVTDRVPADALARRPGIRVARCVEDNRTRRSLFRARVRSISAY